MTLIDKCVYDANGELQMPGYMTIIKARPLLSGGWPTFNIGFYHRINIRSSRPTYEQTYDDSIAKMRRFYGIMNQVEGFSTLSLNKTEGDLAIGGYVIAYDVVYVIENTGSPTQDPESPYAGYKRDLRRMPAGKNLYGQPGISFPKQY